MSPASSSSFGIETRDDIALAPIRSVAKCDEKVPQQAFTSLLLHIFDDRLGDVVGETWRTLVQL